MKDSAEIITRWIAVWGIVFFGAIVHATSKLKMARDKKKEFTILDFLILIPLSAFSGLIFGLIGILFMPENQYAIMLFSGIGSFLGMAGLNKISNVFLEVIASRIDKK